MNDFNEQLRKILEKISFKVEDNSFHLTIANQTIKLSSDFKIEDLLHSNSFLNFREKIYELYNSKVPNEKEKKPILIEDIRIFRQRNQEDRFWSIDAIEKNGTIVARKNSEKARIPPKGFYGVGKLKLIIEGNIEKKKIVVEMVHVVTSRKIIIEKEDNLIPNTEFETDTYIYMYGKNILRDEFGEDTVRFYFNLVPNRKKIRLWIHLLSYQLDEREIPYNLKYLQDLNFYKRTDAGVLYVHKQNFTIVAEVINNVLSKLDSDTLQEPVPMFTKKLMNGLSFAENPLEKGSSFGIHKSNQIMIGILKYLISLNGKLEFNIDNCLYFLINERLFDVQTPFLNPTSRYFYQYSIFDSVVNKPYRDFTYTKNKYLKAAQYFAKLLGQKAIWIDENNRTWMTYTEKTSVKENNQKIFRPVNNNEREGIEYFFDTLDKILKEPNKDNTYKPYYIESNSLLTIKDSRFIFPEIEINQEGPKEPTPHFKIINNRKEAIIAGNRIIKEFINIKLPVINRFGNFEFNPTLTHGLAFYGYLFLRLYSEKVPKLTKDVMEGAQR